MKTNKDITKELEQAISYLLSGDDIIARSLALNQLKDIIWDEYRENSMELFLKIQERERLEAKELLNLTRNGLQDAMHLVSNFSEYSINNKLAKCKSLTNDIIFGENIANIIHIMRAYFPKGNDVFASKAGKSLFNKFVEQLLKCKEYYVVGGKHRDWADRYGHSEYIDLVLSNYDNNKI